MSKPFMGFVRLQGQDSTVWKDTPRSELLSIFGTSVADPLSAWVTDSGLRLYHRLIGRFYKQVSVAGYCLI